MPRIFKNTTLSTPLLLAAFLFSALGLQKVFAETPTTAEEQDSLPIEVTADKLVSREQEGESVYTGHVIITQGPTQIKGDKVTLFHPNRNLTKAIVIGTPATFKRFLPEEQSWVSGHANKITYDMTAKNLLLEQDAYVNQDDKNSISGPKIQYDLTRKTLSASSTQAEDERVKVIFQPDNNEDTKEVP
ncbi:MAG: lipopolysaccharide transport periplasmic protein LptA [Hydrogenovibrio sp.]